MPMNKFMVQTAACQLNLALITLFKTKPFCSKFYSKNSYEVSKQTHKHCEVTL